MKETSTTFSSLLTEHPGKVWLYGVFPLFGLVFLGCLLFGNCAVFTPDQRGYRLFQEGRYQDAARTFVDPQWQAAARYRDGNFREAAAILSGYDTATGAFNHGNSLVMLGNYEDAIKRYERALELKPDWQAAENNLEIAAARAERTRKEGGEMTGGMLAADDITFTRGKASPEAGDEIVEEQTPLSDAEMRAVWLRNVQTRPADFLRSKFSYQLAMEAQLEPREDGTD